MYPASRQHLSDYTGLRAGLPGFTTAPSTQVYWLLCPASQLHRLHRSTCWPARLHNCTVYTGLFVGLPNFMTAPACLQRSTSGLPSTIQQAIGPHEGLLMIVKRRKLQWYGHVSRSSGLAKTILQGTVKGGRSQGRLRKRWEDSIRE